MRGLRPGSRKRTTARDPDAPARPDLAGRRFCPPVPATVPCGDMTYLRTGGGRPCPAAAVGLATRMVAGRRFSARMAAGVRVAAPGMAKGRGHVAGSAVSHSGRGSRCTSAGPAGRAAADDVGLSAGRTGRCRDNAVAESLRASLENEMHCRTSFAARGEAKTARTDWIERCCNRRRPRSAVGYRHPAEPMEEFEERAARAFADEVSLAA